MGNGYISIRVQPLEHPSIADFSFGFAIDPIYSREYTQILDLPSEDAPTWARMFCSNPEVVTQVMKMRKIAANELAEKIEEEILNHLKKHDTIMGYDVHKERL